MEIRIDNIQKKYGKQTVLNGASFSAVSGECIGILGDNGCGKSTLLTILAGVQRAVPSSVTTWICCKTRPCGPKPWDTYPRVSRCWRN